MLIRLKYTQPERERERKWSLIIWSSRDLMMTTTQGRSQAYLCKSFRVLIYKNDSNDGRNINFIHRSYSFTRGRRSLSFLVISVPFVYVCYFLYFVVEVFLWILFVVVPIFNLNISVRSSRLRRTWFQLLYMGCTGSKHELSLEDLQFLKAHTSYSDKKIKSWYKGFMVRSFRWISFVRIRIFV